MFRFISPMLFGLLAFFPWQAPALDPKQIFEAVAPSTVLIDAVDSGGSGVVISEQGLILTNYHVVAANIGLKIRAKVKFGSKVVVSEIDDVQLTKVHPVYDLALLQAKPPANGVFIPARIIPKETPIATGSKCFAIGNPGGPGGKTLDLTITEGLVSSASREMEGLSYIQISAQINPGNSGGPVCDEFGRVFGLATVKMTETEGIGFAIPTQKTLLSDFIEPKAKKTDLALAVKAESAAVKLLDLADETVGQEREAVLLKCAELYHLSLLAAPNSAAPYANLCVVYQKLDQPTIAKKYIEKAVLLAPNDPNVCHMLGGLTYNENNQDKQVINKCMEIWKRGLTSEGNKLSRGRCADDIGILLINHQDWLGATYMFRWSEMLTFEAVGRVDVSKRGEAWIKLRSSLPEDSFMTVRNKKSGFSWAQFEALQNGKMKGTEVGGDAVATQSPLPTKSTAATDTPPPATSAPALQAAQLAAQALFAGKVVSLPEGGMEAPLPDVPTQTILANFGWQVVMSLPSLTKIGVFNLATGQFDGFIDCEDPNPLLAAASSSLVVYLPRTQEFELYNLTNLQKVASSKNPIPGTLAYIGIGASNPNRAFALWHTRSPNGLDCVAPATLTLPDFKPTSLVVNPIDGLDPLSTWSVSPSANIQGAMDDSGTRCAVSQPGYGFGVFDLSGVKSISFHYYHVAAGSFSFAHASGLLVADSRIVDLTDATSITSRPSWMGSGSEFFAPITGYPGYVERFRDLTNGKPSTDGFRVHSLPSSRTVREIPIAKEQIASLPMMPMFPATRTMLASATADRIVYVVPRSKTLHLFSLGLKGSPGADGAAHPGNHFERKLNIPAGSTVVIQSAPRGLIYKSETSSLLWEVPADFKTGQLVQVLLLVTPPGGKPGYAVEKISIP